MIDLGPDTFTLTPELPEDYSGPVIAGANAFTAESKLGRIILQDFSDNGHRIQLQIFRFIRNFALKLKDTNFSLRTIFTLKNDIHCRILGNGKLHLREGQFTILKGDEKEVIFNFEENKVHEILEVQYDKNIVDKFAPAFPDLTFNFGPNWAGADARKIVHEFFDAEYSGKMQQIFFENKVREYLFYLFAREAELKPGKLNFTPEEETAVHKLRDLITSRLDRHLTIPELARAAVMNEFKLKSAFRLIYGMGIFEYLQEERMKYALILLATTDKPVKQIASLTGFSRISSFITSFRNHYKFTPGSVRRK
jgi:AraC-like DNA-binding protein